MTSRTKQRKRLPRWPKPKFCGPLGTMVNDDSGDRIGAWSDWTFATPAELRGLHDWLSRWLAAYDARQKGRKG